LQGFPLRAVQRAVSKLVVVLDWKINMRNFPTSGQLQLAKNTNKYAEFVTSQKKCIINHSIKHESVQAKLFPAD